MEQKNLAVIAASHLRVDKENTLGQGSYGTVYQGEWKSRKVAIKQLYIQKLSNQQLKTFQQETEQLAVYQHINLLPIEGICVEANHYAVVMPYLKKGSLWQLLNDTAQSLSWDTPKRWTIAIGMGKGLTYLHAHDCLHGYLRSSNVLLDDEGIPKLTDAGRFELRSASMSTATRIQKGMGITRWYPPEALEYGAEPVKAWDVYSYGMVLWEIASRQQPFAEEPNENSVIDMVGNGVQEKIPADCPPAYAAQIKQSWWSAEQRPTAADITAALEKDKPTFTL